MLPLFLYSQKTLFNYSNALEEIFYPAINEIAPGFVVPSYERFTHVCHVEGLQLLLHSYAQNEIPLAKFVEKLCRELESFVKGISKHLVYQETEVNCFMPVMLRFLGKMISTGGKRNLI